MKLLLALLGLTALSLAQDQGSCDQALAARQDCLRAAHQLKKDEKDKKHKAMDACFVNAGCTNPGPQMEEAKDCMKNVIRSSVLPQLRDCQGIASMSEEDLVDRLTSKGKGKGKGHGGPPGRGGGKGGRGGKGGKGGKGREIVEAFCPRDNQQQALACIESLEQSMEVEEERFHFNFKRAMDRCDQDLSFECFEQMRQEDEGLCECGQNLRLDRATEDQLNACKPEALKRIEGAEGQRDSRGRGGRGGRGGRDSRGPPSPSDMIRKNLCGKGRGRGPPGGFEEGPDEGFEEVEPRSRSPTFRGGNPGRWN